MAAIMNFIALLLFSASVIGVYSQTIEQISQVNMTGQQTNSNTTGDDPVFTDPMVRLMNASSIEELLSMNILYKDGHVVTASDLGAVQDPQTGKLMVSGGAGSFAVPDGCHPRETSVEIDERGLPPTNMLYPRCVKVLRCGGCCGSANVECVPLYVERTVIQLVQISMGSPGGYQVVGPYPMQIERHVSCKCECTLSEEKCGPFKEFDAAACACLCILDVRCSPPKMFNPDTCSCECAVRQECCPSHLRDCNFEFNEETCECDVPYRVLSSSNDDAGNLTEYQRAQQAIMGGQTGNNNNNAQQQPAVTTTPTTSNDNCGILVCPPHLVVVNCACIDPADISDPRPTPRTTSRSRSRSRSRFRSRSRSNRTRSNL